MLEPRHVVPHDVTRCGKRASSEGVEIGYTSAAREQSENESEEDSPTAIEEVRVVEVDVDEVWEHATTEGTSEIAERVRCRNRAQCPSRRQLEDGRCGQRGSTLAGRQVGRPSGA